MRDNEIPSTLNDTAIDYPYRDSPKTRDRLLL